MTVLTIDTTHLLREHNCRSSVVGSSDSWHSKTIPEARKIACSPGSFLFLFVVDIRIVVISRRNDVMSSKTLHGLEPLGKFVVLHKPSRGLWAKPDTKEQKERGNEGRAEL